MTFIPETPKQERDVPYFDDVSSEDGWRGHTTSKSLDQLKSEISVAISRLGGVVTGFIRGRFKGDKHERDGFQIHYMMETPGGVVRGRLDIAALPVRISDRTRNPQAKRDQSLRMALFMTRTSLEGAWFLQQLSPGYAALMPWMLEEKSGRTISELWSDTRLGHLLPEPEGDFLEGDYREA